MSNVNTTTPPQTLPQYSVNWNNVALQAITTGLDAVPVVGDILSHLLAAFWPSSGQDVWAEVQQNVQKLINQALTQYQYDQVQTALGSASQNSGLVGVLNTYLGSVTTDKSKNNGMNPQDTFTSANLQFTNSLAAFQQQGAELLLLPLFAQFANMHLSLLRDGVQQGWVNDSVLGGSQGRIEQYMGWANEWYQKGYGDRQGSSQDFNYLNQYVQAMQVGVMNFRETWKYFDPTQYKPPVKVVFTNQTYFTITGQLGMKSADQYGLPATPDGDITGVDVFWLLDNCDNYSLLFGTQVNYTSGQQPYQGVPISSGTPLLSPGQSCDADNYDVCNYKQGFAVNPANPIVSVGGDYNSTGGVYAADFVFKDGSSTGQIPNESGMDEDYKLTFNIAPPAGYYLRSVWTPPQSFYYGSAADMVFGFGYVPQIDEATARALYTSSLNPVPDDDPTLAPFAQTAASEDWEGQREAFLARLKPGGGGAGDNGGSAGGNGNGAGGNA